MQIILIMVSAIMRIPSIGSHCYDDTTDDDIDVDDGIDNDDDTEYDDGADDDGHDNDDRGDDDDT